MVTRAVITEQMPKQTAESLCQIACLFCVQIKDEELLRRVCTTKTVAKAMITEQQAAVCKI